MNAPDSGEEGSRRSVVREAEREMERCHCRPDEQVARITTQADDGEASAWVCALRFHHAAAVRWVEAISGKPARVIRKEPARG